MLRYCYADAKAAEPDFSYGDLDRIFEIALINSNLFPGIHLAGGKSVSAYLQRWVSDYRNAVSNPPSTRTAKPKSACSDPAVRQIVMAARKMPKSAASLREKYHNLFMSAENIQGNLLEEYIAGVSRPYGWIWCAGNTLRAVDFCSSDGTVLLQIKNKFNTENSSSSSIREGTSILKWYRLGTRSRQGTQYPVYKWEALNQIINDHRTAGFQLPPCCMTEEDYLRFITGAAAKNPELITWE